MNNIEKYHIDGEPASADDIINKAKEYSQKYANDSIHLTSSARMILSDHGHRVGTIEELRYFKK